MITDFGLSLATIHSVSTCGDTGGTPRWMAPELIPWENDDLPIPTPESDVWSYGCLCLEASYIYTRR
jgi:serine/threonine protein kinase